MTTITKEGLTRIIETADEVLTALAGTNEDVRPESDNMLRLWDDLNDRHAPPAVVKEMARLLLAGMEQEQFGFVTKRCAEHMHDNDHDENNWMWSISAVVIGCDPKLKHEVPVYLYPAASIPSAGGQVEGK